MAILKLREPVGQEAGWIGIAFSSDTNYYSNKVFHKLSYPGSYNIDSTMYYNSDTLYYNYGYINVSSNMLFINSPMAWAIHGQSGSSLFYTDNIDYYSFGTTSFEYHYVHARISVNTYYQLKNIMDNYTGIKNIDKTNISYNLYPNPFSDYTTLQFDNLKNENYNLEVFNNLGQLIKTIANINTNSVKIERDGLNSGIYFFRLQSDKQGVAAGKFILK